MIEIVTCRMCHHAPMICTFTIRIPKWANFEIRNMTYFKKDNKKWVTFPSSSYEKDGQKKYFYYNAFQDMDIGRKFLENVRGYIEAYLVDETLKNNAQGKEGPL